MGWSFLSSYQEAAKNVHKVNLMLSVDCRHHLFDNNRLCGFVVRPGDDSPLHRHSAASTTRHLWRLVNESRHFIRRNISQAWIAASYLVLGASIILLFFAHSRVIYNVESYATVLDRSTDAANNRFPSFMRSLSYV